MNVVSESNKISTLGDFDNTYKRIIFNFFVTEFKLNESTLAYLN